MILNPLDKEAETSVELLYSEAVREIFVKKMKNRKIIRDILRNKSIITEGLSREEILNIVLFYKKIYAIKDNDFTNSLVNELVFSKVYKHRFNFIIYEKNKILYGTISNIFSIQNIITYKDILKLTKLFDDSYDLELFIKNYNND